MKIKPTLLAKYKSEISKCVKCGTCITLCPVYKEDHLESLSPRGKLSLLTAFLDGEVGLSKYLEKSLKQCAGCLKCQVNCPNGVLVEEILVSAWAEIFQNKGTPLYKKIIFEKFLLEEKWFKLASLLNFAFGWIFFKNVNLAGQKLRFPLSKLNNRLIPKPVKEIFKKDYQAGLKVANPKRRIILYTGCLIDYFYPETATAFLKILSKKQIEAILPANQSCCGVPLLGLGDLEKVKILAQKNLEVFRKNPADKIIFLCATCLDAFKRKYRWILGEDYEKYRFLEERFMSASVFLRSFLSSKDFSVQNVSGGKGCNCLKVAYHDPCHLNLSLGIWSEPRELIKMVPGVDFIKLDSEGLCCGFGGSFNLDYYNLSQKINNHIIQAIQKSKPDFVLSACPACQMQIRNGLSQVNSTVKVKHLVEFLAQAL